MTFLKKIYKSRKRHVVYINVFLTVFCLFVFSFSYSQRDDYFLEKLGIKYAPFNKNVKTIFKDSYGFLWFGTNDGLFKYDGGQLTEFVNNSFDEASLPNNTIYKNIIEDKNGNLWLGTESYLVYYNRKQNKFYGFDKGYTYSPFISSSKGSIWVNQLGFGLIKLEPKENNTEIELNKTFTNKFLDITSKNFNSMIEDNYKRLWLSSQRGIFLYHNGKLEKATGFEKTISLLKPYKKNSFMAVCHDGIYILEYNTLSSNLKKVKFFKRFLSDGNLPKRKVNDVLKDAKTDDIWVGTNEGLFRISVDSQNDNFERIQYEMETSKIPNSNSITSLCYDDFDNLWVGGFNGVSKLISHSKLFKYVSLGEKVNTLFTQDLFVDNKDNVWVTMGNGELYRYNSNTKSRTKIKTNIWGLRGVTFDKHNNQYLLYNGNKIFVVDQLPSTENTINPRFIKKLNNIADVLPLKNGEIWVGQWGKGVKIIKSNEKHLNFKKEINLQLKGHFVFTIEQDKHGNIWVGTRGGGVFRINIEKEKIKHYETLKTPGFSSNATLGFCESENDFWIATRSGGVMRYNFKDDTFYPYNINDGLNSISVYAISKDAEGVLWLSTSNGIARYDKSVDKFLSFGYYENLNDISFNFRSTAVSNNKENVYFGCNGGICEVDIKKFKLDDKIPKTLITRFASIGIDKQNNKTKSNVMVDYSTYSKDLITLSYNRNNVVFEFSNSDFTAPDRNKYAYKLEGVNDFWVYTNHSNKTAIFNDLKPGDYVFKVKSSNAHGVWNETPTTLSFKITPPYWLSTWAYIIYFIVSLILIYIAYFLMKKWYELKQNIIKETVSHQKDNEHNRMKMIFFTDISHELRTPLSLISGVIEKIQKEGTFNISASMVSRIKTNADKMGRLISQIMDIRKFDAGEFKISVSKNDLIAQLKNIKSTFDDFADIYNIDFFLNTNREKLIVFYDNNILEKILYNLLSNAFKYTPQGGTITINVEKIHSNDYTDESLSLKKNGKHIKCSVKDSGVGIPAEDLPFIFNRFFQANKIPKNQVPGTGIGMELVQKLIECHNGVIKVESEENVYTEFTFYLPVSKKHFKPNEIEKSALQNNPSNSPSLKHLRESEDNTKIKNANKPKVLLVEDNREIRAMLKEELIADFNIIEASNGQEGFDLALAEKPQLIVSDILMPVQDGITFLRNLKSNSSINHIPIIMLTSKDALEIKIECLSLGADDYIEKPFSLEFVKWKIKNTIVSMRQLKEKYTKVISAEPTNLEIESHDEKFIKRLVSIIENSIDDNLLSVEYLASEAGTSRANLYRKLQAISNETPSNFIKKVRLKRAAQILEQNKMYVSEVAFMCGFNNQKYFSKCFQKEYGLNPKDYAKQFETHFKINDERLRELIENEENS